MNQLTASDRSTIAKLLGLVGSTHDAEALAAARKAHELVKARGITWPDLLGLDAMPPASDHVILARDLLGKGRGIITRWEAQFLRGVLAFKALSDHQRQTLDGIREKVLAATSDMEFPQHTE
jgi:hypothetical protein